MRDRPASVFHSDVVEGAIDLFAFEVLRLALTQAPVRAVARPRGAGG